jgi:hypothetical protein
MNLFFITKKEKLKCFFTKFMIGKKETKPKAISKAKEWIRPMMRDTLCLKTYSVGDLL